jgi:subtilisin family serine protease
MQRSKWYRRLGVGLILLALGITSAGNIHPNFLVRLREMPEDTMVTALVFMRDQVNVKALETSLLTPERIPFRERHARVIKALQEMARVTQGPILKKLEELKNKGDVEYYKSFWISNLIVVKAKPAAIQGLAARTDVSIIYEDVPITNIQPVSVKPSGPKTRNVEGGIQDINAPQLWAMGVTGVGRIVSHLDTGVDGDHPALHDRWRGLQPGVTPDEAWFDPVTNTNYPFDSGSHGTHTMGTMCGRAGSDTVGVAPDAFWISAGVIDRVDIPTTIQDAIAAFQWIADPDGDPNTIDDVPDVCSNSWGLSPIYHSQYTYPCDTLFWSYIDACEAAGVAVVFAAGNEGPGSQTLRTPADRATTLTNCFAVGALQPGSQTIADFSSRGPSPCTGVPPENLIKPEVCARGVDVRSSVPGGGYSTMSGTSMACPHVAGAIALLRQVNPDATPDELKMALLQTAVDLGPTGEDNTYGMGRIDVYAAAMMLGGSKVEGYVYEQGTGNPIEGALLEVIGSISRAYSDSTGFYRLYVSGGETYQIAASAYGHRPDTQSIYVPQDSTVNLDFYLTPADSGTFDGFVYSASDSTPIEGAVVYAQDVPIPPDTTGPDGHFSIRIPGGATYTFVATAIGYRYSTFDAFIPENGTTSHDFFLTPTEDFESGNGGYDGYG